MSLLSGPQTRRTDSLKKRISPKVASTWSMWSRSYMVRNTTSSMTMPLISASGTMTTSASRKLPLQAKIVAA